MLKPKIRPAALTALTGLLGLSLSLGLLTEAAGVAGASKKVDLGPARKALLVRQDLPSGWTSAKSSNGGSNSFPGESKLAACIGVPVKTLNINPPSANSPEFSNKAQNLTVDDSVGVFTSSKVASRQFAAIANAKTAGCYSTLLNGSYKKKFESAFGSGATIGTVTVSGAVPAGYPARTAVLTLTFTVVSQGTTIPVNVSEVFTVKGTLGQQLGFTAIGVSFPASLSQHLTSVAAGRL